MSAIHGEILMNQLSFEDLVENSVRESLTKILGEDAWKAVSFFFNVRQVATHPETFSKLLDNLFGRVSRELQRAIVNSLLARIGSPAPPVVEGTRLDDWYAGDFKPKVAEFQEWLRRARAKFGTPSSTPLSPR